MFLMAVSDFFSLGLLLAIWSAISRQHQIPGYTPQQIVLYMIVARVVQAGVRNRVDRDLANLIYRGNLAQELRLPVNHQLYTVIKVLSRNGWSFLYGATVTVVLSTLFIRGMRLVPEGSVLPALGPEMLLGLPAVSVALGLSVSSNYCIGLLAMWTRTQKGIAHLKDLLFAVLSGALIPLDLFPDWLRQISAVMPYRWIVYEPTRILTGLSTPGEALRLLAIQCLWVLGLGLVSSLAWKRAVRKLEVHGE
ncbi:MAG: ABC-2 family transporter protein [bacterium]|nr:ABC-2 family transporter protein [bacterium]